MAKTKGGWQFEENTRAPKTEGVSRALKPRRMRMAKTKGGGSSKKTPVHPKPRVDNFSDATFMRFPYLPGGARLCCATEIKTNGVDNNANDGRAPKTRPPLFELPNKRIARRQ
eukprot:GEMP01086699.1.p2 GENE.GEMP01086699.1~~GEMP01086699.1.p2  ORF type:complete len:113 (+),score=7.34 GEMP01086699.1:292-630(+)